MKVVGKDRFIIYLDQFATSELFDVSPSDQWAKILYLLKQGVENGILMCPMSTEHFLETSQRDFDKGTRLNTEFEKLSKGYSFKPDLLITSQLMVSLLRKNNITLKTYLYEKIDAKVFDEPDNRSLIGKRKDQFNSIIKNGTELTNEIRKVSRGKKTDLDTFQALMSTCKALTRNKFIARLSSLHKNKYIKIGGVETVIGPIPDWIDSIVYRMTVTHRINERETKRLIAHLEIFGFDKIPTLDIRMSLSAFTAASNKRETAADQIDFMRIATGLPLSDILLTDKRRKYEIQELGLDKKYNTQVFSGTKQDINAFIHVLEKKVLSN